MANRASYIGNLCGTNVRFSPFEPNKLVVSQAQNFGIVGNGWVSVLSVNDNGTINVVQEYATQDACYDAWFNEDNENQILTAGGDSTLKLWDFMHPKPVASFEEHKQEVFSWEWSHIDKRKFVSSSYDQTIKVWDVMSPVSLHTLNHAFVVYQATWHPTHESIIASCSGDETFRIWDLRVGKDVKAVKAHDNEILTIDFNKYDNYVATGSTDSSIKVWDLRATLDEPILNLSGHVLAVKKVKFSPYHANTIFPKKFFLILVREHYNCR